MGNYRLYRLGQFLAGILPFGVSNFLVMVLCDFHYFFSKADRRAVAGNLKVVEGKQEISPREVRSVFRNFGRYLLEFFTMKRRLGPDFIKSNVDIKNIEYINQVLKKGKGAILVSAHLGNWEMGGAALGVLGYPLSVVALAHKDPRVNSLFNAQREFFGARVIQTDAAAVRRIKEHLQQNRLVAILAERDFNSHGIVMDFLGRPTSIPKGAAFFSIKTGVPIIPIFFNRTQKGFMVNVYPPIDPPCVTEDRIAESTVVDYIKQYLKIIEDEIRKDPSQWLLFREFWQS